MKVKNVAQDFFCCLRWRFGRRAIFNPKSTINVNLG
jgi:hypothetical protein